MHPYILEKRTYTDAYGRKGRQAHTQTRLREKRKKNGRQGWRMTGYNEIKHDFIKLDRIMIFPALMK